MHNRRVGPLAVQSQTTMNGDTNMAADVSDVEGGEVIMLESAGDEDSNEEEGNVVLMYI